ncbi:MAG: VPLPA-CTERM sorting domain-containing protein [Rhodocyclaceae bacterium]|nr:VPLPA-CTERM sorting domain-containing protein [Rhodocyclaceae bacterium]MCB1961760.1 VPLPA-CTERM sorting domain-containing protein [Rhodocyclaceae bacterium]
MPALRPFVTPFAVAVFMAAAPAAQASSGWYLNPEGSGIDGASFVSSLNVGGYGFIEQSVSRTHWFALDFEEHGAYQVLDATGTAPFGSHDITVSYAVSGYVGLFGSDFTAGTIDIYSDAVFDFGSTNAQFGANNGTLIASFSVDSGQIDPLNGQAALQASVVGGSVASGYFFDINGVDLAGRDDFSFSLGVQNSVIDPSGTNVVGEIACEQAGFTGRGCNGRPYRASFLNLGYSTVQDVGVVSFNIPDSNLANVAVVPEPTSALMMLSGLLGIGAWRRFKK